MGSLKNPRDRGTFEESLRRLEEVVSRLEEGSVPLEESLKLYEEGMELSRDCLARLRRAEVRLKRLAGTADEGFRVLDDVDMGRGKDEKENE